MFSIHLIGAIAHTLSIYPIHFLPQTFSDVISASALAANHPITQPPNYLPPLQRTWSQRPHAFIHLPDGIGKGLPHPARDEVHLQPVGAQPYIVQ